MKLKSVLLCLIIFLLSFNNALAQEDTTTILEKAYSKAKKENKNVFIMFHASWCGWCKKMDKNMKSDKTKALFENNYIIEQLVVLEANDKKHQENPGAFELLKTYNGEKSGIPFWLIFDAEGILLMDSFNAKGQNLGCPASQAEVTAFTEKLKNTSSLTKDELAIISEVFLIKKQ